MEGDIEMNQKILEVCVDSVESALAAERGGADRLELCQNLVIGGTTPSPKLFETIRRYSKIPIHVLLRPRFGDFCYTQYEFEMLREEVTMYRKLGAEGVVIGMLLPEGTLDIRRMEKLMEAAEECQLLFIGHLMCAKIRKQLLSRPRNLEFRPFLHPDSKTVR